MVDLEMLRAPAAAWLATAGDRLGALLLEPSSRLAYPALLAALAFAALAYKIHVVPRERLRPAGFVRWLFPAAVYRHRSFQVDLWLALLTTVLRPARLLVFGLSAGAAAAALAGLLGALLGPAGGAGERPGAAGYALLVLLLFLAYDLSTYVTHRLSHRVPALWAFHRVHHSAEQLNPLTVLRKHPVYDAFGLLMDVAIVAPLQAVVLWLWSAQAGFELAAGVNLVFGASACAAATLRHSHVWLSFGPSLNRLLVSPAMHQIHHSRAERHWDRNYGEVLAVWDWMFGSLYLPREKETLEFGLAGGARQPHPTLAAALAEPFAAAGRSLRPGRPPEPRA